MKKLAIVITHPIQYYAPWFKLLATRNKLRLRVLYTWSQSAETVKDKTFGRDIKWDIPLLEGYDYEFVENKSKAPGSHRFLGIDCPDLIPLLKAFAPDAILFFGWNFKSHLQAMRYFHGKVPVWFRGDSTLLDEVDGLKTKLRRLVLKTVYRYVDKAFYVGQANKAYFLKHGLSEAQLIYAPHAVDNNRFFDDDTNQYAYNAAVWKDEIGIPIDQITIVFAGKFEDKKQPQMLVDAVIKANARRNSPIALLMIGNGPSEPNLKTHAKGIEHIWFLPFQNQSKMPLVYRLGNILCLPSKGPGETWGLAVNEAMACGRPVIVSDKVGCSQDLVQQKVNGFIFKHDDLDELTTILVNLQKSELHLMGETAKENIKKYNFLNIITAIESKL